MRTPTLALYFDDSYFENGMLTFIDDYYAEAYNRLLRHLLTQGIDVIIASNAETTYSEDFRFRSYWRTQLDGNIVTFEQSDTPSPEFDLLYDKGRFPYSIERRINPDSLGTIARDKYLSYLFADDLHALSFLLTDTAQLAIFLKRRSQQTIVLKELSGHGGKQVYVGPAATYDDTLVFPLLAQEFIDTSGGCPPLADGLHDIRVALFNRTPIHGLIRQPKAGNLKSNFSEGGSVRALYVNEIPQTLVELTQQLDERFDTDAVRFFCADWGFDRQSQTWRLFEINAAPGLALESVDGPAANEFNDLLADNLIRSTKHAADRHQSA